jgi:hypothetical protein
MTSSARYKSGGGIVSPSALAVLRLMSSDFPLDSFFEAPRPHGGSALKLPTQPTKLAGRCEIDRVKIKNHSPSREHLPWALDGGAETGV